VIYLLRSVPNARVPRLQEVWSSNPGLNKFYPSCKRIASALTSQSCCVALALCHRFSHR